MIKDDDVKELQNKSFICCGGGGHGKTTLLTKLNKNNLVLCYTNKACNVLRNKGLENVFTFDSHFKENECISDSIEMIQIDEFSMIPSSWIKLLYKLKRHNLNLIIQMFGDPNQCGQVCQHNRYFDYLKKFAIKYICDNNMIVKEYILESARYDNELHIVVSEFLKTGKLPDVFKPINKSQFFFPARVRQHLPKTRLIRPSMEHTTSRHRGRSPSSKDNDGRESKKYVLGLTPPRHTTGGLLSSWLVQPANYL